MLKRRKSEVAVGLCRSQAGFTLIEFLISTLLASIVLSAIYGVYRVQAHSVKAQESRLDAQEYARAPLDMMVREIRSIGHFPVTVTDLLNCSSAQGGIVIAAAQTLSFNLDADGNGNCVGPNERITYTFSGSDITRAADGAAAENLTDGNATNLRFIYYPRQTGAAAPPPYCFAAAGDLIVNGVTCSEIVTANLANIQRVSISLTVQSKNPDAEFGGSFAATMTSNADLRNRGLSS